MQRFVVWKDAAMNARIDQLVGELTVDEKSAMVAGVDLWHTAAVPRLGGPALKVTDGPAGARGERWTGRASASFPCGTALGATWNPDLVRTVGERIGGEARSKGAQVLLAPTVNIHRSPLAGRNFECYSEDPYLAARMAVAYVSGVQSRGVGTSVKHFVCNDSEFERTTISSEVGERALRERTALFDDPGPPPEQERDRPENRALARQAAAEAVVLLKNAPAPRPGSGGSAPVLPLDPRAIRAIAVIGPNAEVGRAQGGGSAAVRPHYVVSPLAAIRARAGDGVQVSFEPGCAIDRGIPVLDGRLAAAPDGRPGVVMECFEGTDLAGDPVVSEVVDRLHLLWLGDSPGS